MDSHIEVVAYDPAWPTAFEQAADHVERALGDRLERIEHIGSTAVPGLPAKPIVDIRVMVATDVSLDAAVDAIEASTDFTYEFDMHHWKTLRREGGPDGVRAFNLHLTHIDRDEWRKNVMLRDYLRDHPEACERYAAVKRRAARDHPDDIEAYMDAKDGWIKRTERLALSWYRAGPARRSQHGRRRLRPRRPP